MIARRPLPPPPTVKTGGVRGFDSRDGAEFTFAVTNVWKGAVEETIRVRSSGFGGACGYNFDHATHYLVYASARSGALWTGLCSRNSDVRYAVWDRLWLPKPHILRSDRAVGKLTSVEVIALMNGDDPDLQYGASEALGGSPEIREAVLPILRDIVRGRRPGDAAAAARAIGQMGEGGGAAERDLGWLLSHGSGPARASALAALVRICGFGKSNRYILAGLSDKFPECLKQACVESSHMTQVDSFIYRRPAAQRLSKLVHHPNFDVRAHAIFALVHFPQTGIALLPELETISQSDTSDYVRYAARSTTWNLSRRKLPHR